MKNRKLKLRFWILSMLLLSISCKKDVVDNTVDCNDGQNRNIEAFFNALNNQSGYTLYESMDLLTHEYTFTTTTDIQVCGFGYKSAGNSLIYTIELQGSNGMLYTGNHSFSSAQFDYVSIPPITLTAGTYTLRRTVTNNSNLSETIGPITRGANNTSPNFPINLGGNITIESANFYGSGGPVPNYGVPNIYFEYVEL